MAESLHARAAILSDGRGCGILQDDSAQGEPDSTGIMRGEQRPQQ